MATHHKGKKRKKCFVVSAIGNPKSGIRERADAVFNEIIEAALNLSNLIYKVERIDKRGEAGDITEGIIDLLRTADLVIVDLTDLNPNVLYEMGIRQAWNLPLIPIITADQLGNLPFDVKVLNTVPYSLRTQKEKKDAIVKIRKQLRSILLQEQRDTVFSKAISLVGKRFSMNSVYESFSDALTDTDHAIFDFKHELPGTLNLNDQKTLENFASSIRRVFDRLSDKLHVFGQIARGRPGDYTDEATLFLIEETRKVLPKADNIDKLLMRNISVSDKINKVNNLLDDSMRTIGKIAEKIKTKLN